MSEQAPASFANDLADSKSTSGGILFLIGPNSCVPISWICKKQTVTSKSSTETEIVSLDTNLRLEGIPALLLWEQVLEVFSGHKVGRDASPHQEKKEPGTPAVINDQILADFIKAIDYVPNTLPPSSGLGLLVILEDNEPVIKICIKQRWPQFRHVPRTHRINLDWLMRQGETSE